MDQELIAFLAERFQEISRQDEGLRQEMTRQIDGLRDENARRFQRVEDAIRHTQVTVEALRDDVRQVAEGVVGVSERLDTFRVEVARGFDEVGSRIAPFYKDLERRLGFLEGWAERKDQNAIDVIRKKFGRPKSQ
jgi:hypothetical protein